MLSRNACRLSLVAVCVLSGLMGCEGSAPTPPPANPYAAGGSGASSVPEYTAPPASAPPPTTTPANPFGGPAPKTAANPFGTQTPPKPGTTTPQPAPVDPTKPMHSAVAGTNPGVPGATKVPGTTKPVPAGAAGGPTKTTPGTTTPPVKPPVKPVIQAEKPPVAPAEKITLVLALDPAPAGSFAAAGSKLNLKMPALGAIGPDFMESTRLRVLYPVTPSPFVALGLNDEKKQFREVWNLIEKKKIGQVRNLELSSKGQALSPDGKYLAGKPQWADAISIFGVSQNKPLDPIKLSGNTTKLVAFAGKTRLIFEDNKELHIYSVPGFKPKAVVKLGAWKADDGWALSPGGRYFVAVTRLGKTAGLTITDLDSGTQAATVSLAGQAECLGVAFSIDGKQLAVLLGGDAPQLRVWQVQTGDSSGQFDLTDHVEQIKPRKEYQGGHLEWFPDHRHLLIGGKVVYDAREGQALVELESQPIYPVRVVSPDHVAGSADGVLVSTDLSAVITAESATPAVVGPGTPVPATPVAAAKPVDRTAVAKVELAEVDWSVKLGKSPVPVKATARGAEIPQGEIYMGCLSQSPSGIGFVMYTSHPLVVNDEGLLTSEPGTRFWLEPLDLKNGDRQKSVPLPPLSLLMSVSPDGTRVCTQNANGLDRLDIWAVRDGSNQGNLNPYHDVAPGPEQRVGYAEFLDGFTLLTAGGGRLTLWDTVLNNKAIYEVEIGEMRPEFSPARDCVAVTDASRRMIYFLESKTGKPTGSVALSSLPDDLASACAFHPDGHFFAALTQRIDGGELYVIDLTTGEIKKQFPLPVSGQVIQWVGSDYVLIDGGTLVSVSRECVVWNYLLPAGMHLRDSPDQRHWYIASDPERSNVYNVRGVDMPDSTIVQRIGAADLHGTTLLSPGQGLDLDIQVADPAGETGFADKVKNILTDRLQAAKIKLIPGALVTLTVRDNTTSGWSLSLMHEGQPIWSHELDGTKGPSALLDFEPPKHAFPAGASQGAGQSTLTVRGSQ